MEPISAFATIVGLISAYKSEGRSTSADEYQEFSDWLHEKRHKSVITELHDNHLLGLSVKALLKESNESISEKLSQLDDSLVRLASNIEGFKDVALSLKPNNLLSEQAISILRQLYFSNASKFVERKFSAGTTFCILATPKIFDLEIPEVRFVDDDLAQLCQLDLLLPGYYENGERMFQITRATERFF
jgi:hypothetical protein